MKKVFVWVFAILLFSSLIQAPGIKYSQESALVQEGKETCLTYSAYNPFPGDIYVTIDVSEELQEILVLQEAETKFLPAYTSSDEAIPLKFCFKVPNDVYYKDKRLVGLVTKQDCSEEMKVYDGEVAISTVPGGDSVAGIGGSATAAVVGAPLRVRVACNPYDWNYTLVYVLVAVISALVVALILFRKYRTPKEQRIKEKMKKLKEEMKKGKK